MNTSHIEQPRARAPRRPPIRLLLIGALCALVSLAGAWAAPVEPPATLVKEINLTQWRFEYGLDSGSLVPAGSRAFFVGDDPENGNELWVTDGTAAGTKLVYDLVPGAEDSLFGGMAVMGDRIFFGHRVDYHSGLWESDGTSNGTAQLSNIYPDQMINVNGVLFFSSSMGLRRSDGTSAGTTLIRDMKSMDLTNVAGRLFFIGDDGEHGNELWVSDGTEAGTRMVADLNPNGDSFSYYTSSPSAQLTAIGTTLYFVTTEDSLQYQLWRSDGTAAGTWRVTGTNPNVQIKAEELEAAGSLLYFRGQSSTDGENWTTGLWRTNGLPAGTIELNAGAPFAPQRLLGIGNRLYCAGSDSSLWTSDGTPGGTIQIAGTQVNDVTFTGAADASGRLFFLGDDGSGDIELWVGDGTATGVRRVKNIDATGIPAYAQIVRLGPTMLFTVNDGQIWRSDGTEAGTVLVKAEPAIAPLGIYWYPMFGNITYQMAEGLGKLFFTADDGANGRELWVSDGTAAGTHIVKDINSSGSSWPLFLTPLNSALYFMTSVSNAVVLWKTDGTEAGTSIVKSFTDVDIPASGGLMRSGGALYFAARDSGGDKLWRSDGTPSGTVPILSIPAAYRPPAELTDLNGQLFFVATDSALGRELWVSDGTAAGTKVIKDILMGAPPYNIDSDPFGLRIVGGTLFFMAWGGRDYELWKSDGTASGTVRVRPLGLGNIEPSWMPADFTAAGDRLFFTTGLELDGPRQLWASDGMAAGTGPVKAPDGQRIFSPGDMAGLNNRLLFSRDDNVHGRELWVSDGTASGTMLLRDINPGAASSAVSNIRQVRADGWALFAASAGPDGIELWQTNGTAASTQHLQEIAPGARSSNPGQFVSAGGRVYFIADDGTTGPELWSLSQGIFQDAFKYRGYLPLVKR